MRIVIDSNIIFSAILNSNSRIGDLIFNSENIFEYYSCDYMRYEIKKHWNKLKKLSGLNEQQLSESEYRFSKKINFINEELIPEKIWLTAEGLSRDIDIDDTDFIAMTLFLNGFLWTGDKTLLHGLKKKGFNRVHNTAELLSIRKEKLLD